MNKLWNWFGLSYSRWLIIPRVLLHDMPEEWQDKMTILLEEYEDRYDATSLCDGIRVNLVKKGKVVPTPEPMINYRHPNKKFIDSLRVKK